MNPQDDPQRDDPCPAEDVFMALLQNELAEDERRALDDHLDRCADCAMLVADLASMMDSEAAATSPQVPSKRLAAAGQEKHNRGTGKNRKVRQVEQLRAIARPKKAVVHDKLNRPVFCLEHRVFPKS